MASNKPKYTLDQIIPRVPAILEQHAERDTFAQVAQRLDKVLAVLADERGIDVREYEVAVITRELGPRFVNEAQSIRGSGRYPVLVMADDGVFLLPVARHS